MYPPKLIKQLENASDRAFAKNEDAIGAILLRITYDWLKECDEEQLVAKLVMMASVLAANNCKLPQFWKLIAAPKMVEELRAGYAKMQGEYCVGERRH